MYILDRGYTTKPYFNESYLMCNQCFLILRNSSFAEGCGENPFKSLKAFLAGVKRNCVYSAENWQYNNFCAATIVNLMLNMLPPKYTETLLCTSVLTNLVIDWDVKDTNFISIKQKVTAACI